MECNNFARGRLCKLFRFLSYSHQSLTARLASSQQKHIHKRVRCENLTTMEAPPESSLSNLPLQYPPPTLSHDATAMAPTPRLRVSSPHKGSPDSLSSAARNVAASRPAESRKVRLISYEELPEWHQDNEYIRHGYRPISGSARISFRSWTYIHNETANIYTHLVPAIMFLLGEWYILQYLITRYHTVTGPDIFVFSFFLLCTVICYGVSVTYHTLMNHSNKVEKLWLRMDLVGITIYNLGAFTSGIYTIFWCEPVPRTIYWSMVSQYPYRQFWFAITYPT